MLKAAGCICILLASSGMAYSCVLGLRMELRQAEQLMDLLAAVEGEISYSRRPLPELLLQLAANTPQPFQDILKQGSSRMEENKEADIPVLWKSVCEQFRPKIALPGQAYQILLRTGEVFAYSSLESSLQLLRLGQKKLDLFIESCRVQLAGKQKLYCCLCYMAGLLSIIILL